MRTVIYTCIVGNYDELRQPLALDANYDFVCFREKGWSGPEREGVWENRPLEVTFGDAVLDSRWPKMHPHELFPEYDACVWIDANVQITGTDIYEAVETMLEEEVTYAGVPHPTRDCVYSEAVKCRDMGYISWLKLAQIHFYYWFIGIPRHCGLLEDNLIFRRHMEPEIMALGDIWWKKILKFCRRDQLSLNLCLRRLGIIPALFLPDRKNTRDCPGFDYQLHSSKCSLK